MDFLGPLVTTYKGNKQILVITDYFTKYPEAFALPDQKEETVAKPLVNEIIARHGVSQQILTDRGSNFTSTLIKEVCQLLGVHAIQTTAYHPSANGLVERYNLTLVDMLSHYVEEDQQSWDESLPLVLLAYRSAIQESTQETPFFLMHGRDVELPFDEVLKPRRPCYAAGDNYSADLSLRLRKAFEVVRDKLNSAFVKQKRNHDRKVVHKNITVGDLVLLYTPQCPPGLSPKLRKKWTGPHRVKAQTSDVNFEIQEMGGRKTQLVHLDRLRKYNPREAFLTAVDDSDSETEEPIEQVPEKPRTERVVAGDPLEDIWVTFKEQVNEPVNEPARYCLRSHGSADSQPWVMPSIRVKP